ncbi:MAG: DUF3662 domain-containing protein [Anaerolineae bacterium]|nr:DUF3662 domain-containing protein [Chloroflexota bacterium]MBP6297860.1 DUF3662 domain-containing protein [Anaerolineae bacterium]
MSDDRFTRLEARLEQWVETTFAAAFGYRVNVFDLALHLVRAMESGLQYDPAGINRPLAPDTYDLYMQSELYTRLLERQPNLAERLCDYLITLATQSEYRLSQAPLLRLHADPTLDSKHPRAVASHTETAGGSTIGMTAVVAPYAEAAPGNAHLIVNGGSPYRLASDVVNIGRMVDNDLPLDDPYVSRYHVQLRRRGSEYLLFDINSSRGTSVNGTRVKEHRLRSGDVIDIGRSRLIYMDDRSEDSSSPPTETFEGV